MTGDPGLHVETMLSALRAHSLESITHSKRVARVCRRFGEELGLGGLEFDDLLLGAQLHDVGKLFVDQAVLHKASALTQTERMALSVHPALGAEYAMRHGANIVVVEAILYHHERWDGRGYPNRAAGYDIPFYSRIIALADTYDTIISKRVYDPPRAVTIAVAEIENHAGAQFDPHLAEYFLRFLRRQHRRVLDRAA